MTYTFSSLIDVENYLDACDPPPYGWKTVGAGDHRRALFSSSAIIDECTEWEKRELERIEEIKQKSK